MNRPRRRWLLLLLAMACTGEQTPGNDTTSPEGSPPVSGDRPGLTSTWDPRAGELFAIRSGASGSAWIIHPLFEQTQVLDTLTPASWDVEGRVLSLLDGALVVGTGTVTTARFDSTCAGWPIASLGQDGGAGSTWRVAFPEGLVEGMAFDSLPALAPEDSASRARAGALAASRLPDDTAAAFRGRPFIVRQSSRFRIGPERLATVYEVVRLVPQEANPLEEKLLIVSEEGPPDTEPRTTYHERDVGLEEGMPSIEIVAVLRVRASGALAILVRRERENGFVLDWIERTSRGRWSIRWRSALDAC